MLEAQCSGLPVIATRHTGIADVVVTGETGFLCDEGDVHQMAEDMIKVLRMPQGELEAMSIAARTRIATDFSKEQTLDRLAEVIRATI